MADEQLNQDKPESINEQDQDFYKNGLNGEDVDAYPVGASLPVQTNSDYESVNGLITADRAADAREETAAEIAAPVSIGRNRDYGNTNQSTDTNLASGGIMGMSALAISIISLFVLPIVLGITGVVLGFIARGRGARGVANWAIGIGALSIIIGTFILPFY